MPVDQDARFEVIAQTAAFHLDPAIAIAAVQAGYCGILNLEFASNGADRAAAAVGQFAKSCAGPLGLKLPGDADGLIDVIPGDVLERLTTIVLTPVQPEALRRTVVRLRAVGPANQRLLLEITSPEEAALASAAGCDGIIAKGNETAGRVGESTSFILLQQLHRLRQLGLAPSLPIWAQGGIGRHTVAAAYIAGAAGVVLEQQLLLTRESRLPEPLRKIVARMDGSETQCLGEALGESYRVFAGPNSPAFAAVNQIARRLEAEDEPAAVATWREAVRRAVTPLDPENSLWLFGQDAAFAAELAREFKSVPGIMAAMRRSVETHIADARATAPLAAGSKLAQAHGTEYPIVQGPMTRVSDRAEFALKVAEGGALPFLALALMRGPEVEALLRQTQTLLAGRPWGAGILGFVPADLQAEQLAVVHACRPDFALLAGGRPEQAFSLEQAGIPTYLHAPSPGLLRLFLEAGTKRFVFEGRECGGHVGPRASFILWNQMIDVLLAQVDHATAPAIQILFAGGIHDALSSAMVMAAAAPLARLGCQIGVLVGTAYTMTHEAVEGGAVVDTWQQEVARCTRTALLETGPGHAIRCVDTSFVGAFAAEKRRLLRAGETHDQMRDTLEALNVGRLRIASKGVDRSPNPGVREFVSLDTEAQRLNGLYMIGQVALLRDHVTSIRALHRDIADGGAALLAATPVPEMTAKTALLPPNPANVAIVGMSCILPKAPNLATYWENILDQVDAIREVPEDRWDWRLYFDADKTARDKIYSKWGGFIDDVAFDPLKYGIPPTSLKSIEPLQLLTLEAVHAALIDAGFVDGKIEDADLRRRTSVILGVGGGTGALGQRYAVRTSLPALLDGTPDAVFDILPEWTEDSFAGVLLNVTAGRVANRFDLGGVNFTVDAACGSSLAAIRLAVQELESGASDMVIVGGCDAFQNPFDFVAFSKTHALSPRGKCRTFDASADGIAIGEGVALVVLRRAPDAMRQGARIYARIQGVGGSSDGRDKSLTAPRPEGQAIALERAYAMAHFPPASVGLIEAHGTGTVAGDRAEVTTLKTFFAGSGTEVQACAIGSVKSMIGHTKCAAGTAGLIKAALALYHKILPPTNNVETPNPEANFPESPFFVASEARPWIAQGTPRRAGVSAFGFGGTNFHVALEEHDDGGIDPDRRVLRGTWPSELFLLSAASREELSRQVDRLAADATAVGVSRQELRELARDRAASFRAAAKFRLGMVASTHQDLVQRIESFRSSANPDGDQAASLLHAIDPRGVYVSTPDAEHAPRVAFLFPGQGAQYPNMLRDLAMHFEEARQAFATADATLSGKLPRRLSAFVFPPPTFTDEERKAQQAAVMQTNIAQPAIGAASVGMMRVLDSLGVRAAAAAGHSYGEYVALHHAGAFDEATLYQLSEARGRAMVEAVGEDPGTMASVAADAATIERHLGADSVVKVANRNAPDQTVIAGPRAAIEHATSLLTAQGLSVKPIRVACGFHSPCVAPARDRFEEVLKAAPIQAPLGPVYANMTAALYPSSAEEVVALLADHLVSQVNFQDEILAMHDAGIRVFVEVGPGSILTGLVGRILKGRPHLAIASDMSARPGLVQLQHALAQLAVAGVPVAVDRLFTGRATGAAAARTQRAKDAASATTWLVNGGNARPAREPVKPAVRPVPLARPAPVTASVPAVQPQRPMPAPPSPVKGTDIIHTPVRTMSDTPTATARPTPQPRAETPATVMPTAAPAGASQVMLQYQKLMEGFLQTQQQVMLAYLKGGFVQRPTTAEAVAAPVQRKLAPPPAVIRAPEPVAPRPQEPVDAPVTAGPAQPSVSDHVPPALATRPVPAPVMERVPTMTAAAVADTLVAMISERTGYPAEMLGLDLDIEADLGIDSIKRVEILGAFRQQHIGESTDHVRAAMEQITRKKTLREVVDACYALVAEHSGLADQFGATTMPAAPVAAPALANGHALPPIAAPVMTAAAVADTLIAMISERTGYPAEMLGLDLDIEADLGIDSIKRVEILGAFRQHYIGESTDHVRAAMEQITRRKTLREVVDACHALLSESAGGAAVPVVSPQAPDQGHAPAAVGTPAMTEAAVADTLIAMISERTGYPAEMLGLDLDIEADLGIDSIKRVEILGAFRQQHIGESTDHVRTAMEQITRKKTLREVVDACYALLAEHAGPAATAPDAPSAVATAPTYSFDAADAPRFVIVPVRTDVSSRPLRPGRGEIFLITDDQTGVGAALAARLGAAGARPMLLRMGNETKPIGQDVYSLNLTDLGACKAFGRHLAAVGGRLAGIFHCLPLRAGAALDALDLSGWRGDIDAHVKSLFNLAATFGETLDAHEAPFLAAATRLGGTFGLTGSDGAPLRPSLAGVPGLLKTIDQEWTNTRAKSVDFAADASVEEIAETLLVEAGRPREDVEIGYPGGHRVTFRALHKPLATGGHAALEFVPSSIILVTGGARGITAEVATYFAELHRPVLILCGSSALPRAAEDPATAALTGPREIKSVLIEQARQRGAAVEPAAIEATYRRLLKEREIRANLDGLGRAAASVEYHQVDVRDEAAFGGLIQRIYAKYGRIDGVIHGAGIVEDKLVRDKTSESFDRVVDTKTASSFILARRLRPETLKFLAFFTSVAGTFGNRGQSDYGAANEILSKLALHLDRAWPARVVALSWGPWDKAGMVTPEIKRQFETLGIEAVPVDLGRWAFDAEIRFGNKGEAETVWGAGPWAHRAPTPSAETVRDNLRNPQDSGASPQVVH